MEHATEKAVLALLRRMLVRVVTYLLPFLALLAPALYFLGRIHNDVYWRSLQVPPGVMTQSSEDYIYSGFSVLLLAVLHAFSWLPLGLLGIWITVFVLAIGLPILFRILRRKLRLKQLVRLRAERRKAGPRKKNFWRRHLPSSWPIDWMNRSLFAFLMFLLLILFLISLAEAAGKKDAQTDRENITSSRTVAGYDRRAIAHLRNQSPEQSGVVFSCNASWCAMARRGEVVIVPLGDIERLDHCPNGVRMESQQWACDPKASVTP